MVASLRAYSLRTLLSHVIVSSAVAVGLSSCEYEWKDEPVKSENRVAAANHDAPPPPEEEKKPASAERPVLAPGKDVPGTDAVPANAKRLNLPELAQTGAMVVTSNDSGYKDPTLVYDEIETSLVKSNDINPLKVTFEFPAARTLKAVKVLSTYSDYGWAIEVDGGGRLVVDAVIDGEWSTIAWPEGIKAKKIAVEVLRKMRDNYVHLNEIEIYE
jgi:hypothetical protein